MNFNSLVGGEGCAAEGHRLADHSEVVGVKLLGVVPAGLYTYIRKYVHRYIYQIEASYLLVQKECASS